MAGTEIASLFAALGLRVDEKAWEKGDAILGSIQNSLKGIDKAQAVVGKAVKAFIGLKAIQGLKDAVSEIVDLGGKFSDASQKTGVSAESLQEWGYIAGLAGGDAEMMIAAMGKANKGLAEVAKTGKGPAADGLRALGISLSDPAIKAGNLDEVLLNIADKFQAMPDGPKKVKAAMDIFGKSGADLIPTLNQGGDAIEALREEARELGIVMSNETIGEMDEFGDNVDRVKTGWKGIKTGIAEALIPLLADLMPGIIAAMKEAVAWVKSHKLEIQAFFYAVGQVFDFLWQVIKLVIKLLIGFGELIVFIIQGIIEGFIAIGKWLVKVSTSIVTAFLRAWEWIKTGARALWDGLVSIGTNIVEGFVAVGEGIKQAFKDAFDWVVKGAKAVGEALADLPVIKQLGQVGRKIGGALKGDEIEFDDSAKKVWQSKFPGRPIPTTQQEFDKAFEEEGPSGEVMPGPSPTYTPPAGQGGQPVTTPGAVSMSMTQNVYPSPGMNEQDLADKTQRLFEESLTRVGRQLAEGNESVG